MVVKGPFLKVVSFLTEQTLLPFCLWLKKIFKPTSNNLETITDNESNFNNENNLLLIDVEPALAKGTQIKGKVTLIEV